MISNHMMMDGERLTAYLHANNTCDEDRVDADGDVNAVAHGGCDHREEEVGHHEAGHEGHDSMHVTHARHDAMLT